MRARLAMLAACALLGAELLDRAYWAARGWRERPGGFEVYAVGESTAAGEPYGQDLAPASLLARGLGGDARAVILAQTGRSIYPQSVALERMLTGRGRRPGLVLVYSGHNDCSEGEAPLTMAARVTRALTRRSALARDAAYLLELRFPRLRRRTVESWEYHLRRVIELSLARGLTPVLAVPVANVMAVDPGLSLDDVDDVGDAWVLPALAKGAALEARGRRAEAQRLYESLDAPPALRRFLDFRAARCAQALGRREEAARLFRGAADGGWSGNFGRATSEHETRLRRLASEYGVPLADAPAYFGRLSDEGLPPGRYFIDGQHPNAQGYTLLAMIYARSAADALGRAPEIPATPPETAEALVAGGRWLFTVSARQADPRERLALAKDRYRRALELDARSYPAWVGLKLAELAERTELLRSPEGLDWLGRKGLFYGTQTPVTCEELAELFSRHDPPAEVEALRRDCSARGT